MADPAFDMDIDRERVRVDGEWLTAADLTERIRAKIQAGDFRVSRLSLALETLESTLSGLEGVSLKVTPELLETYGTIASYEEVPVNQILRRALVYYLASEEAAGRLFEANRARNRTSSSSSEPRAE